ncbi:MAG: hydrolase [Rhodospirillaceae bacterium]|nr:hydrolase [Rhodospirillaceae bacterium]MDP6624683.1 metal-dependent hydrolase [Alphaproteobacteria bacterium]
MDSVTQFALGAAVGTAVLGRRIGLRRAALSGGLLGTMPDLDVFWPGGGPVERFVNHRGATHSLIMMTLVTPVFGEGLRRLFADLARDRAAAYLAVFLCLSTHALLDSLTIYGTQLFWPLWSEPVGLGSIFIIDPLYTLPLLAVTLWALFQKPWSQRYARYLTAALVISTAYLGWSIVAQQWMTAIGHRVLAERGTNPQEVMAIPTPFNTLFWRVIALDGPRYYNVYVPVLGGDEAVTVYGHRRWSPAIACGIDDVLAGNRPARRLARFSDGFFRADLRDGTLEISDLRMGLTHGYVFRFAVAELDETGWREIPPRRLLSTQPLPGDLQWLRAGALGQSSLRPAERAEVLDGPARKLAVASAAGAC